MEPQESKPLLEQLQADQELWTFLNRELPPFVGETTFLGVVQRTGRSMEELANLLGWRTTDDVWGWFLPTPGTTENCLTAARNFDFLHWLIMMADETAAGMRHSTPAL